MIKSTLITLFIFFGIFEQSLFAQWTRPSGMDGIVSEFGTIGKNILAATNKGNIYLTTDYGENWSKVNGHVKFGIVHSFASFNNKIFAGTDSGCFISADSGRSWTSGPSELSKVAVNAWSVNGANIFAGTGGKGIFISKDKGESWQTVNSGLKDTAYVYSLSVCENIICASVRGEGVFLSKDSGKSWNNVNGDLYGLSVLHLASYDSVVFAGTNKGLYRARINEGCWHKTDLENFPINTITVLENTIYAGMGIFCLYYSNDNGDNWREWNILYTGGCVRELFAVYAITKADSVILAGIDKGLYRSTDNGKSWKSVGFTDAYGGDFAANDSTVIAGTWSHGILISKDNGETWQQSNNGLSNTYVLSMAQKGQSLFAVTGYGGICRSMDKGTNWQPINRGLDIEQLNSVIIKDTIIFTGGKSIYLSNNNGEKWISRDIETEAPFYSKAFAVLGENIFAGSYHGIYYSADNGENWRSINNGLTDPTIYDFAVSGDDIFAGSPGGGVYKLDINNEKWIAVNNGMTNKGVWCLHASGNGLFAGTSKGVYFSNDKGKSWKEINTGLPDVFIYALGSDKKYIYAGTFGMGIWRRPLSEIFTQ